MRLIYHPAAEAELVAAATYYERKVRGLGSQFLNEFDECVALIMAAPGRWRIVRGDHRRLMMPRFPYGLYYRVVGGEVRILVIKHHRRHPGHGAGRS